MTRREEKTNAAIIAEAVKVLKTRGGFNQTVFRQYLVEAVLFDPPPDERTPKWDRKVLESVADKYISALVDKRVLKWVHKVAESLADKFTVWQAGGLQ